MQVYTSIDEYQQITKPAQEKQVIICHQMQQQQPNMLEWLSWPEEE